MDKKKINYDQTPTAKKGRNGDEFTAHVQMGEIIIPPVISPELRERLMQELIASGIDPATITVGDGMSINPETDMPEFGFGKVFKKIAKIAVPAAAAYFAPGVGGFLSGSLGLGLGAAGQAALGGAALGGLGGAVTGGGLKGVLSGATLGGLGGYVTGGGLGDLGIGKALDGTWAGNQLAGSSAGNALGVSPTFDSIISNPITSTVAPAAGGSVSSLGSGSSKNALSSLLSGGLGLQANSDAEDELLKAQRQQMGLLQPFTQEEWNPGDLTQDPGYQFQLQQGTDALNAKNAASGSYYSGAALKDAAQYAQGLADTTANNSYARWAQGQKQRYGATQDMANVIGTGGTVRANTGIADSNLISRSLSGILGGGGFNAQGQGYDQDSLYRLLAQMRGGY